MDDYEIFVRGSNQKGKYIEISGEKFSELEITKNQDLKQKLVKENPKLAEKLYYRWREHGESELGEIFAKQYNKDSEFGISAYVIGEELGIQGMIRKSNPVIESINNLEKRLGQNRLNIKDLKT